MQFSIKNNLETHRRTLLYLREKRFPCDQCQKQFSIKHNLKSHHRTNTEENPLNYSKFFCFFYYVLKYSIQYPKSNQKKSFKNLIGTNFIVYHYS